MKAIILAAGRGSRMGTITNDVPKCMLKVNGMSLFERQLTSLRLGGCEDVAVVTGYLADRFSGFSGSQFHNPKWSSTNMLRSLFCADEYLSEYPCIISYADIFYSSAAVKSLAESSADIAVLYDENWWQLWKRRFDNPLDDAESFKLDDQNIVIEIGDKISSHEEVDGQYMGLIKMTPVGWQLVKKLCATFSDEEVAKMHMTGMLQQLITKGSGWIQGVPYNGVWGEVDTESDLNLYNQDAQFHNYE